MKKLILTFFAFVVLAGFASAQYRLMAVNHTPTDTSDDYQINEGNVITFNTAEYEPAKLGFLTYNDSAESIYLKVECEGLTNTNGTHMELCYGGFCYYGIESFVGYPTAIPVAIAPGQHQGILFDYFSNTDGDSDLIEYNFRFFQTDSEGFEIPNTSLRFTYRYDGIMAVSDVNSISIATVYPTVAKGFTNVDLKENAAAKITNFEGKVVKTINLKIGTSQIDLSGLSAGVYLIQFKGDSGISTTRKVVVK